MKNDLIDRQAAIDVLCDNCNHPQAACPFYPCAQYIALEGLPSVQPEITEEQVKEYCQKRCLVVIDSFLFHKLKQGQPEREEGRWFFETLDGVPGYRPTVMFCSKCGRVSIADYSYCPNCGVKMKEEE